MNGAPIGMLDGVFVPSFILRGRLCVYSSLFYNLISCIFVFLFIDITLLSLNFKFEKFLFKFNGKHRPRLVKVLCLLDLQMIWKENVE